MIPFAVSARIQQYVLKTRGHHITGVLSRPHTCYGFVPCVGRHSSEAGPPSIMSQTLATEPINDLASSFKTQTARREMGEKAKKHVLKMSNNGVEIST